MNTMIEIYDRIMGVVEEVTGISKDKILTSNCEECRKAVHAFIEENRKEGRAVTASKLTTALGRWKSNMFVKAGIINFLNS